MKRKKANLRAIKEDYDRGMTDKQLANRYSLSPRSIASYRSRYGWGKPNKAGKYVAPPVNLDALHEAKAKAKPRYQRKRKDRPAEAMKIVDNSDLREKQKAFCNYYIQSFNGVQSYLKAYPESSYNTARTNSRYLLAKPEIKKIINDLRKQQASDLYINANDVLDELAKQAFSDIGDFLEVNTIEQARIDSDGEYVTDIDGDVIVDKYNQIVARPLDKVDSSLISEIHRGKDGLVLKLADKQKALLALLDRLPEPTSDDNTANTFIQALSKSIVEQQQQNKPAEQNQDDE